MSSKNNNNNNTHKNVNDVSQNQPIDYSIIQQYVDDKIKELKLDIIKYVDAKVKNLETEGKELVLSDQTRRDVRQEVYAIIKKDVAPIIEKSVAFMQYKTEDGSDIVNKYRLNQHVGDPNQKRIAGKAHTSYAENPLHEALFVFDGNDD